MSNVIALDAILRTHFPSFLEKVFSTLSPHETFQRNWHHEAASHLLAQTRAGRQRRVIINTPPRMLKSNIVSVAWPAWVMGHDPGARFICVSYSAPLAEKLGRDFSKVVQSDWYQRVFPGVVVSKDSHEMLETSSGGARFSTSVGATLTGFGADTIIIDDPMKPDDAASEAARKKVITWFRSTVLTRLNNKVTGVVIVVMQRLHEDDLSGYLLANGNWRQLSLPATAISDEAIEVGNGATHFRRVGDLLDPHRLPASVLADERRDMGGSAFEAQYQQNPLPADGDMIRADWLPTYARPLNLAGARITQSWDTAMQGNPQADFSVCTTWAEKGGDHYLIEVFRERLAFPDLFKAAQDLNHRHRPSALLVEDKGSGTSLLQSLKPLGIPALGRNPKDDKVTRLARVSTYFEAKHVHLPDDAPWLADYKRELLGFPGGKHDDQVDSTTQYLLWFAEHASTGQFRWDFGNGWRGE